jgi:hypothetical protein
MSAPVVEPESPIAKLVRTDSLPLELYAAFHDWRDSGAAALQQVNLDPENCQKFLVYMRQHGSGLPPPVRFVRRVPPNRSLMRHASSWPYLVALQEEQDSGENVLNGCGLSQASSSDTEILQGSDLQPLVVSQESDHEPLEEGELTPEPLPLAPLGGKRKQPDVAN